MSAVGSRALWADAGYEVRLAKAFNSRGAALLGQGKIEGGMADGCYCGDSATAKQVVGPLITAAGLRPVEVGPLRNARYLEAMAMLWIDVAVKSEARRDLRIHLGRLEWGNTMIVEYIRYTVADQARGEDLQRAYIIAANQLDAAPECLAYELTQCEEDAKSWTLRIEWRSTEAHLQAFRKGAHFPAFLEAIRGFMPEIAEMRHYRLTDVQSRKRAQP